MLQVGYRVRPAQTNRISLETHAGIPTVSNHSYQDLILPQVVAALSFEVTAWAPSKPFLKIDSISSSPSALLNTNDSSTIPLNSRPPKTQLPIRNLDVAGTTGSRDAKLFFRLKFPVQKPSSTTAVAHESEMIPHAGFQLDISRPRPIWSVA